METYLLTMAGVIVSVLLFLIGYRQTVGARKERVRVANTDLEKTLLKRIVLESYQPAIAEVARLIECKARDYRVRTTDLLSELQLFNTLFTRIVESDFITPEQRDKVIARISHVIQEVEETPVEEARVFEFRSDRRLIYTRTIAPLLIGVLASIVGSLLVLFFRFTNVNQLLMPTVGAAFGGSLAIIMIIFLIYRLREAQEEAGSESELRSALKFEEEVARVLKKIGARLTTDERESGVDFIAKLNGKTVLIEVKAWHRRPPIAVVRHLATKLTQAIEVRGADEAILVTKGSLDLPRGSLEDTRVRLMTIRQLRNYLVHGIG